MLEGVRVVCPAQNESVRVAAWNVLRGTLTDRIATTIWNTKASVVLLSECDIGMARSGNRDTVADIAMRLGMEHHAFAAEFKELTLGNSEECAEFLGQTNTVALHGNAVISRRPITRASRIPLDDGGAWEGRKQARIGGRNALVAEIDGIWYASTHFESFRGPGDRAAEMMRLVRGLNDLGAARCVIGGDFNTKTPFEPLFDVAEKAWFRWEDANIDAGRFQGRKLDWFFYRGLTAIGAGVHDGTGISDHDLITLEVA